MGNFDERQMQEQTEQQGQPIGQPDNSIPEQPANSIPEQTDNSIPEQPAKKSRKKKWLVPVIILAVLAILAAVCFFYLNDYYHASPEAWKAIDDPAPGITVTEFEDGYIFAPSNGNSSDPVINDVNGDSEIAAGGAAADRLSMGLVFIPGGKVECEAYAPLMSRIAENGWTVVLLKVKFNLAILDMNAPEGITEKITGVDSWFLGGHSLGGVVSAKYINKHPGEYDGLALFAAYSDEDLSATDLTVVSMYGSNDLVMELDTYEEARGNLPEILESTEIAPYENLAIKAGERSAAAYEYEIRGGCHAFFGCYGEQKGDGIPEITNEEQMDVTAEIFRQLLGNLEVR